MKKSIIIIVAFIVPLLFCTCNDSQNPKKQEDNAQTVTQKKQFQNITVLLDLSDRIAKPNQIDRDKELISVLFNLFEERQKMFGFIASRDKFSIAIASQKDNDLNLFKHKDALVIDMSAKGMNKPKFDKAKVELLQSINSIYEDAVGKKTTGADIWTFFRDFAKNYIKSSTEKIKFSNKFIIISDGYLVFDNDIAAQRSKRTFMSLSDVKSLRNKSDWEQQFENKKFRLKAHENQNFENLQVLMLEIKPEQPEINTNEFKIIEKYWTSWFEDMGIEASIEAHEENIEITRNVISNYLKKKASSSQ